MKRNLLKRVAAITFAALVFAASGCNTENSRQQTSPTDKANTDTVLMALNKAIATNANDDAVYINRADYYLSINHVDSALRDILIAINIDEQNANHYITLSDAYLASGNPDKCLDALDKALRLNPESREALLKKAQLYLIMRDYDNSRATLTRLLDLDNINPQAYFVAAIGQLEQGDTTTAIRSLQTALDQDQEYFEAQLQLGILFASKKNPVAVSYLSNAIGLRPGMIEPYYQLGLFFQENGKTESAINTYKNILEIAPDYVPALYNLGYIHLVYLKEFATATDYFTQAIALAPDYTEAYYNRGFSYEQLGEFNMARTDYSTALEKTRNYQKAIEGLNRLDALK
jgi:tetratricopeptide (TPR) repeat protein